MYNIHRTLVCGLYYTVCIDNDNNVWSFGDNECNRTGHSSDCKIIFPKQIKGLSNITSIACGFRHTCCVDYNGNLWTFGQNEYGQLAYKENDLANTPKIIDFEPVKEVYCGKYSTHCLDMNGNIWNCGDCYTSTLTKALVTDIDLLDVGGSFVICKDINNNYYSWGKNNSGVLGNGSYKSEDINNTPRKNWPENIISIRCGLNHSLLLTYDGFVYSFGENNNGKLAQKETKLNIPKKIQGLPQIIYIECGFQHSMCIDINNDLWTFGYNVNSQLGLGDVTNRTKPTKCKSDIIALSHGGHSTLIKDSSNNIWGFGKNSSSELGKVSNSKEHIPIRVLEDKEYLWQIYNKTSRKKSARK